MDAPQINTIAFDCHDPKRLAEFWTALLGVEILHDYEDFIWLTAQREGGFKLAFQQVPDPTPGKNKLHLDGYHEDLPALTAKIEDLGGSFVKQHTVPSFVWNIYADPEGNQFCCGHALES
mgnify:CR=1 FL=1